MPDEPMTEEGPLVPRNEGLQVLLDLHRIHLARKIQALG